MNESNHSETLRSYFPISSIGVDWYNPFNIPIEFKETFSNNDINRITIKIGNHQLIESKYIVVCIKHSEFYVHLAERLKNRYKQNNKYDLILVKLNSFRKDYVFKTDNYKDLEKYLKKLK